MALVADALIDKQIQDGPYAGTWPNEQDFTGVIVAGMADAHEKVGKEEYRSAALSGGNYILSLSGNFYGDEAYALTRLSELYGEAGNDPWLDAVLGFYQWIRDTEPEGMPGYIDGFEDTDSSNAVFYMAHHTLAASYIDDPQKTFFVGVLSTTSVKSMMKFLITLL